MAVQLPVDEALPSATCSVCGEKQGSVALGLGSLQGSLVLCSDCGGLAATAIQNKLWGNQHLSLSRAELTAELVEKFTMCASDMLLDELVTEAIRYTIGPLDADERRIAIALLERLATLGIASKAHRAGCEIWPKCRLCDCPWRIPS